MIGIYLRYFELEIRNGEFRKRAPTFWRILCPRGSRTFQSKGRYNLCTSDQQSRGSPGHRWSQRRWIGESGTASRKRGTSRGKQRRRFVGGQKRLIVIWSVSGCGRRRSGSPRAAICSLVLTGWKPTKGTCMLESVPMAYQDE